MTDLSSSTSIEADATAVATKVCTGCGVERSLDRFPKRRRKGEGHYYEGVCKNCKTAVETERYAAKKVDPETGEQISIRPNRGRAETQEVFAERIRESRQKTAEKNRAKRESPEWKEKQESKKAAKRAASAALEASRKEARKARRKLADLARRDVILARRKEQRDANPEAFKGYQAKFRMNNPGRVQEIARNHFHSRKDDVSFRLGMRIRGSVRRGLANHVKGSVRKFHHTEELLGCSMTELVVHIESQFTKGMAWALVLSGKIHIDHIKALADFDLSDIGQQKEAFGYKNLQPLWKPVNLSKGRKQNYVTPAHILAQVEVLIAESQSAIQQAA